jgi:hypothetical protein
LQELGVYQYYMLYEGGGVMKSTRVLAILFAMMLVIVGYNIPAISAGGGDDAHPWDQEGTGNGGGRSDTLVVIGGNGGTNQPYTKYITNGTLQLAMTLQFFGWYRDLPDAKTVYNGKGVSRNNRTVKLYLDAK